MKCFLCLKDSHVLFNIYEEIEYETYKFILSAVITKYFSFKDVKTNASICQKCLSIITPFYVFCLQIENTHKQIAALTQKLVPKVDKLNENENVSVSSFDKNFTKNNGNPKSEKIQLNIGEIKTSRENLILKQEIDIGDTEITDFMIPQNSPNVTLSILWQEDYSINYCSDQDEYFVESKSGTYVNHRLNRNRILVEKRVELKNKTKIRDKRRKERTDSHTNRKISKFMVLNCDLCNKEVPTFKALQNHFEYKHSEFGYAICCGIKFYKKYLLVHHVDFHLASKSSQSKDLNQKYCDDASNLIQHFEKESNTNKKLQCDQCEKNFSRLWTLKQHQAYHTPKETWKFECEDCKKTLPTHCHLNSHIYFAHKERIVQCHLCFKCLKAAFLNKHLKNHTKKEETENEKTQNEFDTEDQREKWECNMKRDNDEELISREEDRKHYACSICSELFNSENRLNAHVANEHST